MSTFTNELLGDPEIEQLFSQAEDLACMLKFEASLSDAQAEQGLIEKDASEAIQAAIESCQFDVDALISATKKDGVVVPELVRQLRIHLGEPHASSVHYGVTSQDVIDTSLLMRLSGVVGILSARLDGIIGLIDDLLNRFGDNDLYGRTRMQKALMMTVQDRLVAWKTPLQTHLTRLDEMKPRLLQVQLGGAVGTLDKFGISATEVKTTLASSLGLKTSYANWHTRRDSIAEFASWLSMVSGSLGKIGQDVSLMAQNELSEISLDGGGESSAMPHKQNPVGAETLVSLARLNAGLVGTLHQSLVHEQERSGAAWTLEWMVLPQMAVATGCGLLRAQELLASVKRIGRQ